jgi:hypothetical protein
MASLFGIDTISFGCCSLLNARLFLTFDADEADAGRRGHILVAPVYLGNYCVVALCLGDSRNGIVLHHLMQCHTHLHVSMQEHTSYHTIRIRRKGLPRRKAD